MNRSILTAVIIAAVAVIWIVSGQFGGEDGAAPETDTPSAVAEQVAPSVRVVESTAELTPRVVRVFGRSEADRSVTLKAETEAPVSAIEAEEGFRIGKGEAVVRLALEDRQSVLEEARKALAFREAQYKASEALSKKQYSTEIGFAEAASNLASARAAVETAELDIRHTRIEMPFEGVVDDIEVEVGDVVSVGDPIAYVADLDPIVIAVGISERDIASVRMGHHAQVNIIGREPATGLVRFVSRSGNPETRTFRVEIAVENGDYGIPEGITAEVLLETDRRLAHHITPSALTLDGNGRLGVMIADTDDVAHFRAVEIVRDTTDGIWITGPEREARIIVTGQEFVTEGQTVAPVVVDGL